MADST